MLINLRTHEVRHYLRTGEACVVRAMEPQPEFVQIYDYKGNRLYDGETRLWWWKDKCWDLDVDMQRDLANIIAPGTVVSCREKWGEVGCWNRKVGLTTKVVYYEDSPPCSVFDLSLGDRWRSASTMPAWAIRPELREVRVAGVEVKRVQEVTEKEAIVAGAQDPRLREHGGQLAQAAWSERQVFQRIHDAHAKPGRSWADNPYVSVVTLGREGK